MIRRHLALLGALALALGHPATAAAQRFTIPLVVDFEDGRYASYHDHVASQLGGALAGGVLAVESDIAPGRCRLSQSTLAAAGVRATFVDVVAEPKPGAHDGEAMLGAGLVIRHASDQGGVRFLAFLLRDDGYEILAFDNGQVRQRLGGDLPDRVDWPVRIAAREAGGGAEFFLDGQSVGSLSDSRIAGAGFGLIHCGPGRHAFDNWGQNTRGDLGARAAAPPAVPPGAVPPALPGAPAVPPAVGWWVEIDGKPAGPISLEELRARIADGRSTPSTLVWREGMANWAPAAEALR